MSRARYSGMDAAGNRRVRPLEVELERRDEPRRALLVGGISQADQPRGRFARIQRLAAATADQRGHVAHEKPTPSSAQPFVDEPLLKDAYCAKRAIHASSPFVRGRNSLADEGNCSSSFNWHYL